MLLLLLFWLLLLLTLFLGRPRLRAEGVRLSRLLVLAVVAVAAAVVMVVVAVVDRLFEERRTESWTGLISKGG